MTSRLSGLVRRAGLALLLAAGAAQADPSGHCPPAAPNLSTLRAEDLRATQRDRGFLWRLELNGRTSWLYGTMHVNRLEWALPGPMTLQALQASDVLALEIDPTSPALAAAFARARDPARGLRVMAGLQPSMHRAARQACVPQAVLDALPPLFQLMAVSLAQARRSHFHAELGVDGMLAALATPAGKRIVALESVESQLASLLPESEADERELVARGLRNIDDGVDAQVLRTLTDVWARGDEARLAEYPQWCRCADTEVDRRMLRRLMEDRNGPMADKLLALHAQGQRFFAGVGALHTIGAQGLPALLRARGFDVRRIPF